MVIYCLSTDVRGAIVRNEYSALLAMKNQVKLDEVVIVQLQSGKALL